MARTVRFVLAAAAGLAFAGLLGWLKILYYLRTFGIDPALAPSTPGECLRESWFVVQNLGFLLLMGWVALRSRRVAWIVVLVLYALIPLASHYAFGSPDLYSARLLIAYRHTLLKLVPFVALTVALLVDPNRRVALSRWPTGLRTPAAVLIVLAGASWGISAAKHFGSFDANLAISDPDRFMPRMRLERAAPFAAAGAGDELFLVTASRDSLFLLAPAAGDEVRVLVVPRTDAQRLESAVKHRVQPGSQFL